MSKPTTCTTKADLEVDRPVSSEQQPPPTRFAGGISGSSGPTLENGPARSCPRPFHPDLLVHDLRRRRHAAPSDSPSRREHLENHRSSGRGLRNSVAAVEAANRRGVQFNTFVSGWAAVSARRPPLRSTQQRNRRTSQQPNPAVRPRRPSTTGGTPQHRHESS